MQPEKSPDEALAAAKAQLLEVARQFDPLSPLRRHPFLTITLAGASGVMAGANAEKLGELTKLSRYLAVTVRSVGRVLRPTIFAIIQGWQAARKKSAAVPTPENEVGQATGQSQAA
jgi:hypothetical protein